MKYRVIGTDPATRRSVSVLRLGAMLMGARPLAPSLSFSSPRDGLSAKAIRESASRSMARLGVPWLDAADADPQVCLFGPDALYG